MNNGIGIAIKKEKMNLFVAFTSYYDFTDFYDTASLKIKNNAFVCNLGAQYPITQKLLE